MLAFPFSFLLVAPFNQDIVSSTCLSNNLYGIFDGGKTGVFILPSDCWADVYPLFPELESSVKPLGPTHESLVWVEPEHVDESLLDSGMVPLQSLSTPSSLVYSDGLKQLWALDRAGDAHHVQDTMHPFWKATILPKEAIQYLPVPKEAVDRVRALAKKLRFDPVIASVVNAISLRDMAKDVAWLTGEAEDSPIVSRHSFAEGSRTAAHWLKDQFEATGASCQLKNFMIGFAPNVVCRYTGSLNTTATVLISAHYDSRGSFGSTRAPGANDDGSGTTALLAIAKTIARKGVKFQSNVELVAFAGEEQGLYGSRGYARELRQQNANLTLMIQADMLAYHGPNEPPQLGLPDIIGTPEVTSYVANISAIYSPELVVGFTPACCSDHQSFHEQGFPATQVYERAGPILDPMYHNSGDLSRRENYDLNQVRSIAKVQFATLLHSAGYNLIKEDDDDYLVQEDTEQQQVLHGW